MTAEIYAFQVTTAAGVTQAAPLVTELPMPARQVRKIVIRVPPGPLGSLGFAFGAAGQPVIPVNRNAFIVTDNQVLQWDLEGQITSGAWQCFTYNTGIQPHTIYVQFHVDLPASPAPAPPPGPIPGGLLTPIPDAGNLPLDLPPPPGLPPPLELPPPPGTLPPATIPAPSSLPAPAPAPVSVAPITVLSLI